MGLFHRYVTPGKGVKKDAIPQSFGFRRFFSVIGDKFWKLSLTNMLFFLVNFPLFFLFAYLAGVGGIPFQAPSSVLYQPLMGVIRHESEPFLQALHGVVGTSVPATYPTATTYSLLAVGCLALITMGLGLAAMTYIHRNFTKAQPVDLASDFFRCILKNWKQSVLLGLLDILFVFVIAYDIVSYLYANQSFAMLLMLYGTAFLALLYLLMRPYMYLMSVTFDIKIGRIIKNSFILAIKGLGRNLLCGVFALLVVMLNVVVFAFIPSLGVGMLFIFTISMAWYFQIFGAWPIIKKFMIDPYYEEKPVSQETAVFQDRG